MKKLGIVCLVALLACLGCKREKAEVKTMEMPVPVQVPAGNADAVSRVEALYADVFAHYNRDDYAFAVQPAFSSRLRGLWSQLPDNEMVYDADIWTGVQDFDSLVLERVTLNEQIKDTAVVTVRFWISEDVIRSVQVRVVRESLQGNLDWYVDDIVHPFNDGQYSVAGQAKEYAADSIVYFYWQYQHGSPEEDSFMELRYKDSVLVDGFFWGTSDEFYEGREGYYPGFSVWRMQEINVAGDTLSFLLDSRGVDYFSAPLALDVHSAMEARQKGLPLWRQEAASYFQDSVRYTALLRPDTLVLDMEKSRWPYYEDHIFVRKTQEEALQMDRSCSYEKENRKGAPFLPSVEEMVAE